jgi:lipopolysaccharide export system permease protein
MTFLIVLFVLLMQFLWLYIDELVGKGLGLGIILEFLGWGSATLFPLALPLATLLASIMTMGSFGENNELLAMKAAGIPLLRILAPLIVTSEICFFSTLSINSEKANFSELAFEISPLNIAEPSDKTTNTATHISKFFPIPIS